MKNKFLAKPLSVSLLVLGLVTSISTFANISVNQSTNGILAQVNDEVILKSELIAASRELAKEYQAQHISIDNQQLQNQALNELVTKKLQLGIIKRSGFVPNENLINQQLEQIAASRGFGNLSDFQKALDAQEAGGYSKLRAQLIEEASLGALWQAQVAPRIKITNQEIDAFLNSPEGKNINVKQTLISEWQTSHMLAQVDDSRTDAMAQQKINALYAQLQQGADFANLAATYSDDTGSATQKGSLGWVSEGQMVPEFETVMKNTETGDYSTPFRSQFGWHILKINNKRQRDITEQKRAETAREILFNRMATQAEEDWVQELKAGAYIHIVE